MFKNLLNKISFIAFAITALSLTACGGIRGGITPVYSEEYQSCLDVPSQSACFATLLVPEPQHGKITVGIGDGNAISLSEIGPGDGLTQIILPPESTFTIYWSDISGNSSLLSLTLEGVDARNKTFGVANSGLFLHTLFIAIETVAN